VRNGKHESQLDVFKRLRCACSYLLCNVWCAPVEANTVLTFSSYADVSIMKCPGQGSQLRPQITNERLRRLNWMLNNYYNSQLSLPTSCTLTTDVAAGQYWPNSPATPAGTYSTITAQEMQAAVWVVTGVHSTAQHRSSMLKFSSTCPLQRVSSTAYTSVGQ
jgi:hypothetical protein